MEGLAQYGEGCKVGEAEVWGGGGMKCINREEILRRWGAVEL